MHCGTTISSRRARRRDGTPRGYTDYRGHAQEFVSMAKLGFLFQGQRYKWQKARRGTPSYDLAPKRFICYLQDHDQDAKSATGARFHELTSPGRVRALTATGGSKAKQRDC